MDAADFVLKNFSGDERKELPLLLALSADAVEEIVTKGALEAMNSVNAK
jgi:PTH1 family peptidyl-tRNA hydrolase